ncbi:MAG: epoxyqueuosine reductase, partial [Clostridia bacterium]|nr:epoxyqueuosine reductase [Clostridia bacterium]
MDFKNIFFQKAADCLENHPANRIDALDHLILYDRLLIGYGSANDPLFETLKDPNVVGPHYLQPNAWLPEAETVISFFLSFSERVRKSNRAGKLPSIEWLYARIEGQAFINTFTKLMLEELINMDLKAVAPSLDPQYRKEKLKSNWS